MKRGVDQTGGHRLVFAVATLGALLSAAEMAWLYGSGGGLNRVYYGTDTRAQGLLCGAALAAFLAMRRREPEGPGQPARLSGAVPSRLAAATGVIGAGALAFLLAEARNSSDWLFRGGFLAVDLAVLGLILGALGQRGPSPVRLFFSWAPLRGVGLISYGLYLWHFPLMEWLTTGSTGLSGAWLLWLRLAASFGAALCSFFLLEEPVRRRRLRGLALRVVAPLGLSAALAVSLLCFSTGSVAAARPAGPNQSPRIQPGACHAEVGGHRVEFSRCPPLRVLLVGDSIALTIGLEISSFEWVYGVAVRNAASLGCGFLDRGRTDPYGTGWIPPNSACRSDLDRWQTDERRYRPQVVVVEMGYWDEANWLWHGRVAHIGEPGFDEQLRSALASFVRRLSASHVHLVFLGVPMVSPAPWPDGSPAPQASLTRGEEINSMLSEQARRHPGEVSFFPLASYLSPEGHYQSYVDGGICRSSDGIHLYTGVGFGQAVQTRCGARLQRGLFSYLLHEAVGSRPRG